MNRDEHTDRILSALKDIECNLSVLRLELYDYRRGALSAEDIASAADITLSFAETLRDVSH